MAGWHLAPHVRLQRRHVHRYAGLAYLYGVTSYFTWALPIVVGITAGLVVSAPRLNRIRSKLKMSSPLEVLARGYKLPAQQALGVRLTPPPRRFPCFT